MPIFEDIKNEISYNFQISQIGKVHTHGDLVNVIDEIRYHVCLFLPKKCFVLFFFGGALV